MPKLSEKQRKIVKAKISGKKNRQIAKEFYPNATPKSGEVLVSRELNKVNVREALEQAYAKHNLTPERLVQPISDALDAEKVNDVTGEVTKDHATRLKAASLGLNLIGANRPQEVRDITFIQVVNEQKDKYGIS